MGVAPGSLPALRARRPDDLPALLAILQRVHEGEGYPVRAEAVSAWWLAGERELGGWVAVEGHRLVGHVALHPAAGPSLPLWQDATGCDGDGLAVVSRLFTDRTVRGAGTALLGEAVRQAQARGRRPVLEVDPDSPARALYGRLGWQEAGRARQQWGHRTVDSVAMVLPG